MIKKLAICWDDGLVSDLTLIEYLNKKNIKSSFALSPNVYKNNRSPNDYRNNYYGQRISKYEIKAFKGFEILNHTANHLDLQNCNYEQTKNEISIGKSMLEDIFMEKINGFCYPYGCSNQCSEAILKSYHDFARTTKQQSNFKPDNIYQLHISGKWNENKPIQEFSILWGHTYEIKNTYQIEKIYDILQENYKILFIFELLQEYKIKNQI